MKVPSILSEFASKLTPMLHSFSFRNFFSFKDGATVSFHLDRNVPDVILSGNGFSTAIAVKGANGSGKTQALKVLPFLSEFCVKSFGFEPDAKISVSPFYSNNEPSEFEVEFEMSGVVYYYYLSCTENEVVEERISQKEAARKVKIFERKLNQVIFTTKKFSALESIKLRQNASVISTAHQYELKELNLVYKFFKEILTNVGYAGFMERHVTIEKVSKLLHGHEKILEEVTKFISSCDIGIDKVEILKYTNKNDEDEYLPIFIHRWNGEVCPISHYEESSGTKALFRIIPQFIAVLRTGGLVIFDELDAHLHPLIISKMIDLFLDESTNPKKAQILFSTHDVDVLDLLGKYRVCIVNKHENESFLYRLDDVSGEVVRNDRSIIPLYKDGKLGGVPRL